MDVRTATLPHPVGAATGDGRAQQVRRAVNRLPGLPPPSHGAALNREALTWRTLFFSQSPKHLEDQGGAHLERNGSPRGASERDRGSLAVRRRLRAEAPPSLRTLNVLCPLCWHAGQCTAPRPSRARMKAGKPARTAERDRWADLVGFRSASTARPSSRILTPSRERTGLLRTGPLVASRRVRARVPSSSGSLFRI